MKRGLHLGLKSLVSRGKTLGSSSDIDRPNGFAHDLARLEVVAVEVLECIEIIGRESWY